MTAEAGESLSVVDFRGGTAIPLAWVAAKQQPPELLVLDLPADFEVVAQDVAKADVVAVRRIEA